MPVSDSQPQIFIPVGFAGGLLDKDTGLIRFGWRDYDPEVGRFTAPDPARDMRGDGDLYDYCMDDPVSRIDILGLKFTRAAAVAGGESHRGISHPFGAKHGTSMGNASESAIRKMTGGGMMIPVSANATIPATRNGTMPATQNATTPDTAQPKTQEEYRKALDKAAGGRKIDDYMPAADKAKRFFILLPIFENMAKKLIIDVNFLLAHAAYESGWLEDHNTALNNLFGLTNRGGRNAQFDSLEECADSWMRQWGSRVKGVKSMDEYIKALRHNGPYPYNSKKGEKYDEDLRKTYRSVLNRRSK